MPTTKITYTNKVTGGTVTADDMNEIKTAVNNNADFFDNKISSVGDTATVSVNCDSYNCVDVAGIAQNFTIANPTGTPVNMQKLLYRIKDAGAAKNISYGDQFQSRGIIMPTTTIAGKYTTMLFIRNTATSTWDLIGLDQEPA